MTVDVLKSRYSASEVLGLLNGKILDDFGLGLMQVKGTDHEFQFKVCTLQYHTTPINLTLLYFVHVQCKI